MLRFKASSYVIHAAGWLLFLIFPLLFLNYGQKGHSTLVLLFSSYYWLFCLTYMVMFYFNLGYLIPQFLLRKWYIVYIFIVLFLLACVYFLQPFDKLLAHNPRVEAQLAAEAHKRYVDSIKDVHRYFGPLPHQDLRMQDPAIKPAAGIATLTQYRYHKPGHFCPDDGFEYSHWHSAAMANHRAKGN